MMPTRRKPVSLATIAVTVVLLTGMIGYSFEIGWWFSGFCALACTGAVVYVQHSPKAPVVASSAAAAVEGFIATAKAEWTAELEYRGVFEWHPLPIRWKCLGDTGESGRAEDIAEFYRRLAGSPARRAGSNRCGQVGAGHRTGATTQPIRRRDRPGARRRLAVFLEPQQGPVRGLVEGPARDHVPITVRDGRHRSPDRRCAGGRTPGPARPRRPGRDESVPAGQRAGRSRPAGALPVRTHVPDRGVPVVGRRHRGAAARRRRGGGRTAAAVGHPGVPRDGRRRGHLRSGKREVSSRRSTSK